jgi:ABC-type glycerol-3-phosphate transport system substrate-binding protein
MLSTSSPRRLCLLLALLLALAACGMGGGSSEGGEEAAAGDEDAPAAGDGGEAELSGEITFQTLQLQPTFTDYINGVIADFEEQHPEVTVEWIDIPFEGAAQRVITDASTGELPDVINLNPDFALPLAVQGTFMNMDEAAADVKDGFVPGAWSAFVYPQLGHAVALPWYLSTEVTMYNADQFEEAGLDPATPPSTFDELFTDASTIAEQTDHFGMHPALENRLLVDWAKLGVPIVSEDGTEATFDTPEAVGYLEQLKTFYDQGVISPDSVTETHTDEIEAYQAGRIALFPSGANFLTVIEENAPDIAEATRVGPQITGPNGVPGMSVMGILVPEATDNPDAALAFAKFMTNAENQLAFSQIVTILPSTLESLEDPYFTEVEGEGAEAEARRISAEQITEAEVLRPVVVSEEFNAAVVERAEAALLGQVSPQEAVTQAQQAATEVLQRGAAAVGG